MEKAGYTAGRPKKTFKRKYAKKAAKGIDATVRRAVASALRSRGLAKPEVKHLFQEFLGAGISNALNTAGVQLGLTTQGVDEGTAVGLEYTAHKVRLRVYMENSDVTSAHLVRVIVVEDRAGGLATLVPYNSAASYGYLLFESNYALSLIRDDDRFTVLHDEMLTVAGAGAGAMNTLVHDVHIPLGNKRVRNEHHVASATMYTTNRQYWLWVITDASASMAASTMIDFQYSDV